MFHLRLPLALLAALAGPSAAFACTMSGENPSFIVEVESLHTNLENGDYAGFIEDVRMLGGIDATGIANGIAANFPNGFESCRTIVQRRDIGGMTQSIAIFLTPDKSIYLYSLSAIENGAFKLLTLTVSEDAQAALANLR